MAGQYTVGAFEWTTSGPTQNAVRCSAMNVDANAVVSVDDSGQVYDQAASMTNFDPTGSYTSKDISNVLSAIALSGTCFGSGKTITSVQNYFRKLETCVDTVTSSSHLKYAFAAGLLRLQTLTADRNSDATITWLMDALSFAEQPPLVVTDGVALPTILADAGRYRLGLCMVNDIEAPYIEGISIDYNVSTSEKEPAFGTIYAESIGVLKVQPTLTIRGRDLSRIKASGTFELGATAGTHATMLLQFKKLKDSESYEANASTVHVKMTMDGIITPQSLAAATSGGRATNQLTMRLLDDGTNAPIVTTIDVAYDTTPAG